MAWEDQAHYRKIREDNMLGPGSRMSEYVYLPGEYLEFGDQSLRAPPLINSSLLEMAKCGWYLFASARYLESEVLKHGPSSTKIRYHFYDKDNPSQFLTFKLWCIGRCLGYDEILRVMSKHDLTPTFRKRPSWTVKPHPETELQFLERINAERAQKLKNVKRNVSKVSIEEALEKLNHNVVTFPVAHSNEELMGKVQDFLKKAG